MSVLFTYIVKYNIIIKYKHIHTCGASDLQSSWYLARDRDVATRDLSSSEILGAKSQLIECKQTIARSRRITHGWDTSTWMRFGIKGKWELSWEKWSNSCLLSQSATVKVDVRLMRRLFPLTNQCVLGQIVRVP
jgi:hypothetical protein